MEVATQRPYRMKARAEAVQATRENILRAAAGAFLERWFDEVTVAEIATAAGVSPQTVVNHFGTKDAVLLAAMEEEIVPQIVRTRYAIAPGEIDRGVRAVLDDYEKTGRAVLRTLALEERVPAIAPVLTQGRKGHRDWTAYLIGPRIEGLTRTQRDERVTLAAAALDVFTWKLLRLDRGWGRKRTESGMRRMLEGALA